MSDARQMAKDIIIELGIAHIDVSAEGHEIVLLEICRKQQDAINALSASVEALEGKG